MYSIQYITPFGSAYFRKFFKTHVDGNYPVTSIATDGSTQQMLKTRLD